MPPPAAAGRGDPANEPEPEPASAPASRGDPAQRPLFEHEAGLQEILSREDFRRVADVRRAIWRDGMLGLAVGLGCGWAGQAAFRLAARPAWWRGQHTGASVLASGALVSFLAAMRRGRPEVEAVGDVFTRHSAPDAARFPYAARQHEQRLQREAAERASADALLRRLGERDAERRA